jgi:amidase
MPDFRDPRHIIPGTDIDVGHASLASLQGAMSSGRLSSATLTEYYLRRTGRVNPALHAVITVNPAAAAEAAASDEFRAGPGSAPRPLEGIPVLVKDNIGVTGMPTTAGSPALLAAFPDDAFLVARLREAGAVIIGKANLSEWANFRSTHPTSGWSTLGGQTVNPYALDRNPSGSSSGSAVGVAAGLAPLAIGTETDGSIVCPASACGVVGIKPTNGMVSRRGIVPISPVQDTAGPMAASVADAAALLSVLAGVDEADPVADPDLAERALVPGSLLEELDPGALDGARLGIWRAGSSAAGPATAAVLDMAVAKLRSLGARLVDPLELPDADKIGDPEFEALEYEFKYGINAYLEYLASAAGFSGPGTLAELIDFNKRNADLVLSRFGQEIFERAEARSGSLSDPAYLSARREATSLARSALVDPLSAAGLDAVISLSASPAWLTDYVLGDHDVFHTSGPAAVAGCPAITVPFGYVSGLPVGVSFVGPRWSEPRLIALAYAFEQATQSRRPPALAATVPPAA